MKRTLTPSKISVLIPDGESPLAIAVLHCLARQRGVTTHILSSDRWAPVRFSRYRSQFIDYRSGEQSRRTG